MMTNDNQRHGRKVHIAFLSKDFPCGGAERVTCDVGNWLCSHGFAVTVFVMNHLQENYPKGFQRLFDVKPLPKGNILWSPRVAKAIRDAVLREKVDILVTYQKQRYAAWLKAKTGVKMVFVLHNPPFHELLGLTVAIGEAHPFKRSLLQVWKKVMDMDYYRKYQKVYHWADAYGVLCQSFKERLTENLNLPADNKVCVLPNSVSLPTDVNLDKEKIILYLGRFAHIQKRVDRLLRIWKIVQPQLPDWKLEIVGGGVEDASLRAMATTLELKNIAFEGPTNQAKKYYDKASILCMTSSYEGWPLVLAEAQTNGVVPILYNSFTAATAVVSSKEEGVLIEPFNEEAYTKALVALAKDDERRKKMQLRVIEKAKTYSIDNTGAAWLQMVRRILNEDRG